jgi:hypothetical protein
MFITLHGTNVHDSVNHSWKMRCYVFYVAIGVLSCEIFLLTLCWSVGFSAQLSNYIIVAADLCDA